MSWSRLARLRVPLGFASGLGVLWLAEPTPVSMTIGLLVALPGEVLRVWASGHIRKGVEITTSGPYRALRHPLYVGSLILASGLVVAAHSLWVALLVVVYMGATLLAAVRTEEATLDARFEGGYTEYRAGRAPRGERVFSWARVWANREYRAMGGFVLAAVLLYLRSLI